MYGDSDEQGVVCSRHPVAGLPVMLEKSYRGYVQRLKTKCSSNGKASSSTIVFIAVDYSAGEQSICEVLKNSTVILPRIQLQL